MRVAFFNWRDVKNPLAGGAEVYVHEVLSRLVGMGHEATLFTSTFKGCLPQETIDGVGHVRYAGKFGIFAKASSCYSSKIKGKFDIVAESINGVPFFTPFFSKEKTVSLIHQLTRENWYSGIALPAAFIGYHAEDALLSFYKDVPCVAPSQSTKSDLLKLGFSNLRVIHGASNISRETKGSKKKAVLCLGRLTKSKRVSHALAAFRKIYDSNPEYSLWVAGSGPEEKSLRAMAARLGIPVRFFGFINESEKIRLLSEASLLLFPAKREGWGLVVLEANSCFTPVIGYDVHGLRDSIVPGLNGYLADEGDIDMLAASSIRLLQDSRRLGEVENSSKEYSRKFSWDRAASEYESLFMEVLS
jgi:glycosyltransferase involved in cell wall biosynthesis